MVLNIKYELHALEAIAAKAACPDTIGLAHLRQDVDQEVQRIKSTLARDAFSYLEDRHGQRYIQYHHQSVISLLDDTARQAHHGHRTEIAARYDVIHQGLEHLLSFLEKHFPNALDKESKAPECYLCIARKEARRNVRKMQREFEDCTDPALLEVLLGVMRKISDSRPGQDISYRKLMYAKAVHHELYLLLEKSVRNTDFNEELRQILYRLNYNASNAVRYHVNYLDGLLEGAATRMEKIEMLSLALKRINQAQVKSGMQYDIQAPSLAAQLNHYIHEEMAYLEKLQQWNGTADKIANGLLPNVKLRLDISVSQLAYLIRLLLEVKIIQNTNLTQLLTFLTKYVITRRTENISYGSFRAKFYNVESGTSEAVKNLLLTMIRHIEKE